MQSECGSHGVAAVIISTLVRVCLCLYLCVNSTTNCLYFPFSSVLQTFVMLFVVSFVLTLIFPSIALPLSLAVCVCVCVDNAVVYLFACLLLQTIAYEWFRFVSFWKRLKIKLHFGTSFFLLLFMCPHNCAFVCECERIFCFFSIIYFGLFVIMFAIA